MTTPDITPAQVVALAVAALNVAVQFGVDLTDAQQQALLALVGVVAGLLFADAHIRRGRARVMEARTLVDAEPAKPVVELGEGEHEEDYS